MSRKPKPVFVQKRTYRQRRLADAARLLPILGAGLILLPLLWQGDAESPARTVTVMFFLFLVWIGLAILAAVISRHLKTGEEAGDLDEGAR